MSCGGLFAEDGNVLEIDCRVSDGGQTISSVEYSLNGVSQGIGKIFADGETRIDMQSQLLYHTSTFFPHSLFANQNQCISAD